MKEVDSLEQTIREENTPASFPVLTIGSMSKLDERWYREECGSRVVEVVLYVDNYLGVGRIYIP